MGIWKHQAAFSSPTLEDLSRSTCLFCRSPLQWWTIGDESSPEAEVRVCQKCGWWSRTERYSSPDLDEFNRDPSTLVVNERYSLEGACAQLKNFDLGDIAAPLAEVRSYLLAKESSRFEMHPRLFELVVTSVFANLGYDAEATAYGNDGGIDVVLRRSGKTIGVQVKRHASRIEAEQIRSLAGALILGDHTAGVFVTTSKFRSGARSTAKRFTAKGVAIELLDGRRFLQKLGLQEIKRLSGSKMLDFVDQILLTGESSVIYSDV